MIEPKWLQIARSNIGVREIPGPKHNPTIMGWIAKLGAKVLGITVRDDETAWCSTFAAYCMAEAGHTPPAIAVRASSWATWGSNLRADRLAPGAILVFRRPGGNHVAYYVGEDATTYHVLGGNQSNSVNIARIEKSRCMARRWPKDVAVTGAPVWVAGKGAVSQNET